MKTRQRLLLAGTSVVTAALLSGCPPPADKSDPLDSAVVAQLSLTNELGSQKVGKSSYSIKASQPITSTLPHQRIQLLTSGVVRDYGAMTRIFNIRTGREKTVLQTCQRIHVLLQEFLVGPDADTVLGQVGDVPGDGVRFVGVKPDEFRYDTYTPGVRDPASITLTRADIQAFDAILDGAIKKAR